MIECPDCENMVEMGSGHLCWWKKEIATLKTENEQLKEKIAEDTVKHMEMFEQLKSDKRFAEQQLKKAADDLVEINDIIFANGANLGSKEYFDIRKITAKYFMEKSLQEKCNERKTDH